jgi:hypothetical protein
LVEGLTGVIAGAAGVEKDIVSVFSGTVADFFPSNQSPASKKVM